MGKKKKEKQRKRVSAEGSVYSGFYRQNHRRIHSVGESATSLNDYLSLNPSVIPSVKSSEKTPRHHVVASFQTNCIFRRRNGRYIPTEYFRRHIPTVSSRDLVRRYIPTDFETELLPSVIITDGKIPSVIPLVFSDFLVVFFF